MNLDAGLLSPVTVGHDRVTDAAVVDALVTAEVGLARAYGEVGLAPKDAVDAIADATGWDATERLCRGHGVDAAELAAASVAGGNPVIPLVGMLRRKVPESARIWVHRGATSQDILDTALMIVARRAVRQVRSGLDEIESALGAFAGAHRDEVGAARTLTQHAVPTTVGLRAAAWLRGIRRAKDRLDRLTLPAQLGGAGGTLASFTEIAARGLDAPETGPALHERWGADASPATLTRALVSQFASEVTLTAPEAPWHTTRWPVTELGDALVATIDAVGVVAADVATLSRTEIGELAEGTGGGSSAMPQKQNPTASVLIRSAALRAPQLAATLHLASALAVDERPDGAWHAEWPTLRELLRLASGSTATAAGLVARLRVDHDAVARNVRLTRGLVVAERISLVLGPVIGADAVARIVAEVASGGDLADAVRAEIASTDAAGIDVEALVDPAQYTGLGGELVDEALGRPAAIPVGRDSTPEQTTSHATPEEEVP
ncbi:lyase family protein [Agromyces sp. Marseille-P2726]|uniref:lyase family protein n=1 Tax=Agromyces sp. Marseille-P2726 TaxID=2709132 RepID=UPI001C2D4035|nr:lyase family protein [Agromyces sp. Marseille-P2726]